MVCLCAIVLSLCWLAYVIIDMSTETTSRPRVKVIFLTLNIQEQKFDNPTRSMQKIEARSKTCSKRQMKDRVSRAQYVMGGV